MALAAEDAVALAAEDAVALGAEDERGLPGPLSADATREKAKVN